ncbi:hypothetical protein AB7W80_00140 [Providencia rettgeri]
MDKSRQQFEAFIKKETGFDLHRTKFPMTKREDQQYSSHQTNLAWLSWQASRESLINSLEPVGYMESNGVDYINQHGFTHINAEQSGSINIPLYKLD